MRLAGKVAVVTGASRGLGRAMALALAREGAAVALGARSTRELDETAHAVEQGGGRAIAVATDVTRYGDVERLLERAAGVLGRLDVLVNNAGVAVVTPLAELALDDWQRMLDVNLSGTVHGCRAAARYLIPQRSGKIVNVSSIMADTGVPGYAGYGATKGGIIAFTRALGVEWARHNVQVNAIAPGWFETDMSAPAFASQKVGDRLLRDIPMRRIGRPEEVGPLVVYLASAASDFMTGQTIFLDGGHSAA
ncbi:MAG: SDR family oxidoreductase [Candidatus Rokubacteria bacterium]|nr:SDR family oxidoreductase [Candidatus Rokubacteria bacterium]MBI3825031.1 SDR family oxidoreductase [Candidatus Rokubacteria bacterium]